MTAFQDEIAAAVGAAIAPLAAEIRALRASLGAKEPEWVTIAEAAEICAVSPATIRRRISAGQIEATGGGRGKRVRRASL